MSRAPSRSPRTRAETLVAVNTGVLSISDVVHLVVSGLGNEIKPLTLKTLLANTPRTDAKSVLARLEIFGYKSADDARIGELVDPRNRALLADVLTCDSRTAPSPVWPLPSSGPQ